MTNLEAIWDSIVSGSIKVGGRWGVIEKDGKQHCIPCCEITSCSIECLLGHECKKKRLEWLLSEVGTNNSSDHFDEEDIVELITLIDALNNESRLVIFGCTNMTDIFANFEFKEIKEMINETLSRGRIIEKNYESWRLSRTFVLVEFKNGICHGVDTSGESVAYNLNDCRITDRQIDVDKLVRSLIND